MPADKIGSVEVRVAVGRVGRRPPERPLTLGDPSAHAQVGPAALPGEGRARRNYQTPDELVSTPDKDVHSLADILDRSATKFGHKKALGWRDTIRMVKETKQVTKVVGGKTVTEDKDWLYYELSDYNVRRSARLRGLTLTLAVSRLAVVDLCRARAARQARR